MGNHIPFSDFGDYASRTIHHKVRRLIGVLGFTYADCEDLEQELLLHVLRKKPEYDPAKGAVATFINVIVENQVISIIRARRRPCKGYGLSFSSLDEMMEDGGGIDADEVQLRDGTLSRPTLEQVELRLDVQRVIQSLPPRLQDLCRRLQRQNIRQIAIELGVSRQSIYVDIHHLRVLFEEAGLKGYR